MRWFNDEFYRLADELAAELERVKIVWDEEIVRPRLRLWRFHDLSVPDGATINSISVQAYVPPIGWRHWDDVNSIIWSADGQCAHVTVDGEGEPLPSVEEMILKIIDRASRSSDYGEWYEATYE